MYSWIEENIKKYSRFVRVMKKKENAEILLYRHLDSGKGLVVRELNGEYSVYEELVKFQHRNLCECYETAYDGERTIVVEEYVEGMTLAEVLQKGVLPIRQVKKIALQICDGLAALHESGIIHRDIKPENVMIQTDGMVKLIDYDASKIYRLYETKDTRTVGTIGYAAPEQYGESQSDERTDIYAFGILLNVMLTGKHPVNQVAQGNMGYIIEKCIQVNPEKRYESILEVKRELKEMSY